MNSVSRAAAPRVPAWLAAPLALATAVPVSLGLWLGSHAPPVADLRLELAGSAARAGLTVGSRTRDFQLALNAGYGVIAGYVVSLLAAILLGRYTIYSHHAHHRLTVTGVYAVLVAGGCNLAENLLLTRGLDRLPGGGDLPFAVATGLATVRWLLLGLTAPVALITVLVILKRAGEALWRRTVQGRLGHRHGTGDDPADEPAPPPEPDPGPRGPRAALAAAVLRLRRGGRGARAAPEHPDVIPPWPVICADGERWPEGPRQHPPLGKQARWRNGARVPPGREQAALGFCVSGGGIRSACVTLGALQALREPLCKARYLVSVSGGGYTAGAMQLALTGSRDGGVPPPAGVRPDNVFEPGSPEEDHLRRHSKYIAEGTGQWMTALGVILRGLLASLSLLVATVLVLGLALSWAYHEVPLTDLSQLTAPGAVLPSGGPPPTGPAFRGPAVAAVLATAGAAAVCWFLWLLVFTWASRLARTARWLAALFRVFVVFALLLAAVVVVVPLLAWGTVRAQFALNASGPQFGVGIGSTALFTYLAVLTGVLWRRRETVGHGFGKVVDVLRGKSQLTRAVPNGFVQYLVVWAVLLMLAAMFLLILGWATATARNWDWRCQIAVPAVLALLASSLDQTWMSLHPFYRSRLASAFAVRRESDPDGEVVARPYEFGTEQTKLSWYGRRHDGFPQVIFAAAANLSGSERTPPGRRAVSFTLSHDYVGGPDIGYASTRRLEEHTRRHIVRDLTVQSAVAVSGAAFASAMGGQARAFQTLFALSNARLGTWLPNPATMAALWERDSDWTLPRQPIVRRLPYLLREVFGRYPMDDRLLYTTDGGHYENLGLVELLRHGVRTAVCIDASGGIPPFAATLAQAITLAREELGVEIVLHSPERLVPGSGWPLSPRHPLAGLNARLSATSVVTGDIIYPQDLVKDGRRRGRRGRLIVARATLTRDMPYQLLAYANSHPVFPHDGTSDQWFDHSQFDAYETLGRFLGERAGRALDHLFRPL
ncbi:patatin-like phospholipase family protein [Streptomyces sp. FH025]|uniref:patatin-like phospholipase family protein n=1 Tax=Streptomyces sp. FH025 TaxID=2815937 RepID=UPI001A9ED196|nr:patatin-like phospholipase family protein [Streptomyces sp. FH025]MBO1413557.1 patatin-like phospholipase family protein [Streptomyces sp. FH025]